MKELTNATLISIKAALFLVLGVLCSGLLISSHPSLKAAVLLAIASWSFCRFYYFCFYVIERYIDAEFRFSGIFDALRYVILKRRNDRRKRAP